LFIPEPPDKLALLLEQKKKTLTNLLPDLVKTYLNASPNTNVIRMYHGISGIKLLYDHMLDGLNPKDEYLVISDHQKWHALDPHYFEEFMQKRARLDLIIRLILQDTDHARLYKAKEDQYGEKIKLLPKNIQLNTNMVILPNKVIILQTVDPLLAILIENQNVTAMNRALFNTIWEISPC
jgi:hypothetical protein